MTTWIVIIAVGLGSYALRSLPVLLDLRVFRSPAFERTIGHAATAAMAAIVMGGLRRSATSPALTVASLVAASVVLFFAYRRHSMARALLAGGLAYALVLTCALVV